MRGNQPTGEQVVETRLYVAGAVRDAGAGAVNHLPSMGPAAVAMRGGRVVAAGALREVEHAIEGGPVKRIDLPDHLLLPGLVNAHTHLDLTGIGPRPYRGSFVDWIKMVMAERPREPEAIRRAVNRGLRMSRQAGVLTVGDIAGSLDAVEARLRPEGGEVLRGISWLECFGFGEESADKAMEADEQLWELSRRCRVPARFVGLELQPHASYSAGLPLYDQAGMLGVKHPSTHLAETPEEIEFVRDAAGPLADLLREMGRWHVTIQPTGASPIGHLESVFSAAPNWVLAHCNYVTDDDMQTLFMAGPGISVAYCPRASDYFGHRGHRYREMIEAGLNVCLGTDSIICHGTLSILDEMRHLHHRDRTDPDLLLKMATCNGGSAMTLIHADSHLRPSLSPGLIAIPYDPAPKTRADFDPLHAILAAPQAPLIRTLELPTPQP